MADHHNPTLAYARAAIALRKAIGAGAVNDILFARETPPKRTRENPDGQ